MIAPVLVLSFILISFCAFVGWRAAYLATRNTPAVSWIKIVFCGVLVVALIAALAIWRIADVEDLLGITILLVPMAVIAAVVSVSSIVGALIGLARRDRY
jgi:hypothetical protein